MRLKGGPSLPSQERRKVQKFGGTDEAKLTFILLTGSELLRFFIFINDKFTNLETTKCFRETELFNFYKSY